MYPFSFRAPAKKLVSAFIEFLFEVMVYFMVSMHSLSIYLDLLVASLALSDAYFLSVYSVFNIDLSALFSIAICLFFYQISIAAVASAKASCLSLYDML